MDSLSGLLVKYLLIFLSPKFDHHHEEKELGILSSWLSGISTFHSFMSLFERYRKKGLTLFYSFFKVEYIFVLFNDNFKDGKVYRKVVH